MFTLKNKQGEPIENPGTERFFIDLQGKVREVVYRGEHLSLMERDDLEFALKPYEKQE